MAAAAIKRKFDMLGRGEWEFFSYFFKLYLFLYWCTKSIQVEKIKLRALFFWGGGGVFFLINEFFYTFIFYI